MDHFVFARIRSYFVLLDGAAARVTAGNGQFFSEQFLTGILDRDTCSAAELSAVFGDAIRFPQPQYGVFLDGELLLLVPKTAMLRKRSQFDAAERDARQRVLQFHLDSKDHLIRSLYASDTTIAEYVRAWADYFYFDHYSLWIYNKYTSAFTCTCASFEVPRNFIFEQENSSLNDSLGEAFDAECRPPRQGHGLPDGMNTIYRIKLTLGFDGTIGVLSLYSRHDNYSLLPKHCVEIRNSLETKYLQVRQQAHQAMDQINQQFIDTYEAGKLDQFLESIVCQVRESFQCEACSIFLPDQQGRNLELVASCDNKLHGRPVETFAYDLGGVSPTVQVFNSGSLSFSYDLAEDDPNNEGYNESMDHPPRNWIGAPLMSAGQCFGVLRVRNRFESRDGDEADIINFRSGDFMNLLSLCSNLGNLIRIETLFNETETRLAETNASIDEMNDFNKVFLHEIRTPISKFTMAPEIIKRTLSRKKLSQEDLEKVMKQLDDIQVMGDRLEFIAKTFNFDQIVTRRNFEILSVLRDIVFPVINITRAYLRKQYDIDIDLDTSGLQSSRVYGDKTLLNICFNTLIDNAGKYSIDTRRPIQVAGGYHSSGDYFDIVVSNHGLEIHEDEKDSLFEKGIRGREATRQGIGGTGIGLHLAQQIMKEGNGELLLTSLKDPVSFTLRVPVKPEFNEEAEQ
jgi:signal transduction histidine kinase